MLPLTCHRGCHTAAAAAASARHAALARTATHANSPPSLPMLAPIPCAGPAPAAHACLRPQKRSVGRFKASFIKQFAGQELYALLRRTKGAQPLCVTLVATRGSPAAAAAAPAEAPAARGAGGCLGTLDVRLLDGAVAAFIDAYGGLRWPEGVPRGAAPAAYVSNVVVAEAQRGRGLGRGLVGAAAELARERWRAGKVYCHVEVGNEVSWVEAACIGMCAGGGVGGTVTGARGLLAGERCPGATRALLTCVLLPCGLPAAACAGSVPRLRLQPAGRGAGARGGGLG